MSERFEKLAPGMRRDRLMQEDHSKPVPVSQGTANAPCHPDAIHDFYPPKVKKP
jgi:hypothetical protein